MGPAKSITVMAALELGKRRKLQNTKERPQITCSKDIYDIFQPLMCDLEQEEFWVLLLNQATKLIDKVRISTGGIDGTYTDVRTILREALLQRATQIAVVHNHPSGNIRPSQPDKTLTEHIRKAADTMNIHLIDHVVVCEDGFFRYTMLIPYLIFYVSFFISIFAIHNKMRRRMEKIEIEEKIVAMLKTVYDPEIPVNVYDLGLIYKIDVSDTGEVVLDMTLTAPNCPAADFIMEDIRQKVESVEGVTAATINLVFEPEWDKDMMSEEAKLELGFL